MELLVDSTNHAVSQLSGEEELMVWEYSHLLRNEHHDLCKLLSSGIATILRAHAAVQLYTCAQIVGVVPQLHVPLSYSMEGVRM